MLMRVFKFASLECQKTNTIAKQERDKRLGRGFVLKLCVISFHLNFPSFHFAHVNLNYNIDGVDARGAIFPLETKKSLFVLFYVMYSCVCRLALILHVKSRKFVLVTWCRNKPLI